MAIRRQRIADIVTLMAAMGIPGIISPIYAKSLPPPGGTFALVAAAGSDDDADAAPVLTVVANLDKDGIPDLVEARAPQPGVPGNGELIVLLGRKDGSYVRSSVLPLSGSDPTSIVAGDFNRDGVSDVVIGYGNGSLTEFLGDGKGGLISAGEIAHVSSVVSIATADFNHDGKLDLAVSDSHTGTVSILLGDGAGSFGVSWSFRLPMPGSIYRLAAADFNHDGLVDLAVTNDDGDAYDVMLGNGNGTFTESPELSHLKDPNAHCVA
ncbi:FG-GAP repeat domain-containing protein [Acidicapsa dinghuensis]|uniref:FG-GAP repeat domain-containing protein n=1 Tax=Acidicapsa dinghuensis TaxID=2218256 RepID=A0ABW1ECK3_9BACT|nr:VCBS repeat-containing protein [Acidicapsa dinghuensis]